MANQRHGGGEFETEGFDDSTFSDPWRFFYGWVLWEPFLGIPITSGWILAPYLVGGWICAFQKKYSSLGIISPRKGEKKHFLKLVILDSNSFHDLWMRWCDFSTILAALFAQTLEYTDLPNWIQPKNILCVFSLFFFWAGIDDSLFTNEGGRSLIIGGKLTKSTTNSCMLHLSYFQFGEGVFVFWAACQIIRCHPQNNYRQQKQLLHFATLLPWLAGIFSCCCSICSCFGG